MVLLTLPFCLRNHNFVAYIAIVLLVNSQFVLVISVDLRFARDKDHCTSQHQTWGFLAANRGQSLTINLKWGHTVDGCEILHQLIDGLSHYL